MTGRKGGNRLKKKRTAILSGLLAAVCVISSVLQPASASASSAVSPVYPGLSEVRAQLDDDEIITAEDITVEIGSDFDIVNDRTGFVIPDDAKVSILFDGAVDEKGTAFSIEKASDYSARYHVDMKSGHPSYQIIRTITVTVLTLRQVRKMHRILLRMNHPPASRITVKHLILVPIQRTLNHQRMILSPMWGAARMMQMIS